MIWVTDAKTENKIAINPKYVVAVFVATEGEAVGQTFIGLINGNIIVKESELEVVALLGG
jgi:uncharacterized protein YlzI (FlbEa/FlbD family)